MSNQPEILNIDYHRKRLILKALNRTATMPEAATMLGISERQLYNLKRDYNIFYNKTLDTFFIPLNKEQHDTASRKKRAAVA